MAEALELFDGLRESGDDPIDFGNERLSEEDDSKRSCWARGRQEFRPSLTRLKSEYVERPANLFSDQLRALLRLAQRDTHPAEKESVSNHQRIRWTQARWN